MNVVEIHNSIGNRYWIESTEKEGTINSMLWLFHQPANGVGGSFILEYFSYGKPMRETGKYEIQIEHDRALIKIGNKSEFYLQHECNTDTMVWYSKPENLIRFFKIHDKN